MSQPRPTLHDSLLWPTCTREDSQAVTHPGTAIARERLTLEFLWDPEPHGFKTHHVELRRGLTYKPKVRTWIFPIWDLDKASRC